MLRNVLITIEYDGHMFSGWQRQAEVRTVQGVLEEALSKFCATEIKLFGTSRTDAGVHALAQRASFKADFGIPLDKLMYAVNNYLAGGLNDPVAVPDVRITAIEEMPLDFNARFDCKGKMYRYVIRNSPTPDIFKKHYCYQVRQPLDVEKMREAAAHIVGTHDFKCFQSAGSQERETTVRTVYKIDINTETKDGAGWIYVEVSGDGFLYNMVRIIVGTLVAVGLGKKSPDDLPFIIESLDRANAGLTAPAEGLYLAEIYY